MGWLKAHIRIVGLTILASISSFTFWVLPPGGSVPSWTLGIAICLIAVLSELLFNAVIDRREAITPFHRIIAIRKNHLDEPILVIRASSFPLEYGDLVSLYRETGGFEEFAAICLVDHKQNDGKLSLKIIESSFTNEEQRLLKACSNSLTNTWKVHTCVNNKHYLVARSDSHVR